MAKSPAELLVSGRALTLSGVADGAEGLIVADLARAAAAKSDASATSLLVICRDGPRMAQLARALAFFAPEIEINEFPAWDCLPYDRVSPHAGMVAQRMTTMSRLARLKGRERPGIVLTTVNAALQRVPARALIATQSLSAAPGNVLAMDGVTRWLELNGYNRASTVREPGDYAVRGGIVDLYPPGMGDPVRLDFFGDTLESIRTFDAETQRSMDTLRALEADRAGTSHKPLPPDRLYLGESEWQSLLARAALARLTPFADADASVIDAGTRQGRNFAPERTEAEANVFDGVTKHVHALRAAGKRVVIAMWSEGSRERMSHVLSDHGLHNLANVADYPDVLRRPKPDIALAVLGLETGFETEDFAVIGEQDILGDRLVRRRRAS